MEFTENKNFFSETKNIYYIHFSNIQENTPPFCQ